MKTLRFLMVFMAVLFITASVSAQEWSAEQTEVWGNVQNYWALFAKGDAAGFANYFHEKFVGWPSSMNFPQDRDSRIKFTKRYVPKSKVVLYTLNPAGIVVHENMAVAHYFFYMVMEDEKGNESTDQGGWTDILVKQGDKWVMIADCGGTK